MVKRKANGDVEEECPPKAARTQPAALQTQPSPPPPPPPPLAPKAAASSATGEMPQASAPNAADGAAAGEAIGAPSINQTPPTVSVKSLSDSESLIEFLDQMAEAPDHDEQDLGKWVRNIKAIVDAKLIVFLRRHEARVSFPIPASVLDFEALAITAAASGAMLSGFREVMRYENLVLSFEQSAMYEAAGTVFMLDPASDPGSDGISISQLESAMQLWSEEAFRSSASGALQHLRRFSFDVPLPAQVVDPKVAQRKEKDKDAVVFAQPVPLLAGRAMVIAWYGAMWEALKRAASEEGVRDHEERVFKLFEAALSVPIRLCRNPDSDNCRLLSLKFSEQMYSVAGASGADSFWKFAEKTSALTSFKQNDSASIAKALLALKQQGLTFKGKELTEHLVKAMRAIAPYVGDARCSAAFAMLECVSPEFREPTLLMRLAQLTTARVSNAVPQPDAAKKTLVFVLDCLRVRRVTGDIKKDDPYTVSNVTGLSGKTPALVHMLFKKQDLVEFVYNEALSVNESLAAAVLAFRTPLGIWQKFQTPVGEQSLIAAIRKGASAPGEGMESQFALKVAEFRDQTQHDVKVQTLIDLLWGVWSSTFDDEFMELALQEMSDTTPAAFAWHRYLQDSTEGLGLKYRAFTTACTSGPIPAASGAEFLMGTSHLGEEDRENFLRLSEALKTMRRKTVNFISLPADGGALGPDFSKAQLEQLWGSMRLGHKLAKKKGVVRAFVLSSELFAPNVAKHAGTTSLTEPIACDADRMKRVIDFIANKRSKDDVVILFDGRSRQCRKVMEAAEEKLAGSGAHTWLEFWIVYLQPAKRADARAPGRQATFANNTREVAMCSVPTKAGNCKLVQRSEFNACGEGATSATTYTGVPMRSLNELPRMDAECKAGILGAAAASAVVGQRISENIDEKGHPFSQCEVKPLNLWQRICEHHGVTHIVDFSPGSAGLATAVTGEMDYEGVATNDLHCSWLDSTLDLVVKYLAGTDKEFAKKLGADDEFVEQVMQYFAGTFTEAKRYLEPEEQSDEDDDENKDDGESSENGGQ